MSYAIIVFWQYSEATPWLDRLGKGESWKAILEEIKKWDMGSESEYDIIDHNPWSIDDTVRHDGVYTLAWNRSLEYIALAREL